MNVTSLVVLLTSSYPVGNSHLRTNSNVVTIQIVVYVVTVTDPMVNPRRINETAMYSGENIFSPVLFISSKPRSNK